MSYLTQSVNMNVKDLLDLPFANEFKLLAGKEGLDNAVSGGNIMDNPNALDWFAPEEVLVTSGYFLTTDPDMQLKHLKTFKNMNLAAIFIKSLTFFETIPPTLIKYCDELEIPLVEIPYGITFSTIINNISNELSSNVNAKKQLAIDSHNRFFQATLNGGGVDVLTKDLGFLVGNTTIVTDTDWNILAYDKINHEEIQFFTASNESIQFDLDALDDLPLKVHEIKHIIHRDFRKGGNIANCAIMPIYFNTVNYGYIIIIASIKKLTNMDHIVLESASMALALQISQKAESERNNNRVIRDFFKNLLSGQLVDANLLKSVGIDVDYKDHYSFVIFDVHINHEEDSSLIQRKQIDTGAMKKVLEDTKRFTGDTNVELQIFKQSNKIFGIYKKKANKSLQENKLEEKAFFNQLLDFINSRIDVDVQINVMIGSYQPLDKLRVSYEEAIRIESFPLDDAQSVFFYDEFYLELFLTEYIDEAAGKNFYENYLTPLIKYDETNTADLVTTLREYLNNQFNVADTSRKLFIHRNTMLYRLGKIEEILDTDIASPKVSLALQLAYEFYDKKPLVDRLL